MNIQRKQQYKCNKCDKPYFKKGALTTHITPLPRREVYAMGQCSRKPSTPCFVCYQRKQDGIGLYGFVWEVFTEQSLIWLIFSSSLI